MRRAVLLLGVLALFAAGFSAALAATPQAKKPPHHATTKKKAPKPKPKPPTTTGKTATTPTTPAPTGGFPAGVYYAAPDPGSPGSATIRLVGGSIPTIRTSGSTGFDVGQVLVWTRGNELHVISPSGVERVVYVDGLSSLARPSLSPDGTKVAVEAAQSPTDEDQGMLRQWVTVYVVDLATGAWQLFAPTGSLPYDGNDVPSWLPTGNAIAYASTELKDGRECNVVNVADATTGAVKTTLRRAGDAGCETPVSVFYEAPRVQTAFSRDGSKVLLVGLLQILDASTGAAVADVHDQVLAGLQAAGYIPDDRFPGRAGSTPAALAGAFSPDGRQIVFDGSVRKGGAYYQLVMRVNVDGTGFKILGGPFEANPTFAAGNTYSVLSTTWKP